MLQMLGTKCVFRPAQCRILEILISHDRFDIEPFFFSSFLNRIPSRFEADLKPGVGDSMNILPSQYFFRWTSYPR